MSPPGAAGDYTYAQAVSTYQPGYRLRELAQDLSGEPVILAGDFNVMPTELDVYKPENWVEDALFRPEVRAAFHTLVAQGWTRCPKTASG